MIYGQSFDVPDTEDWTVPIGSAKVVRSGSDVTIVAFSIMVGKALEAAEQLADEGIDAEVIDLRTIRPLDEATIIESVKKTNRVVACEEGFPQYGIGAEISARITEQAFDWLDAPIARVAAVDVPLPYAANLEALALPQSIQIQMQQKLCVTEHKGTETMPVKILMPALSPTMTDGTLAKWHISKEDTVSSGDVIAEIETDKATMEVEAVEEGRIGKYWSKVARKTWQLMR